MRRIILFMLAAALAMRLAGQSGPAVTPNEVTMRAGETVLLHGWQHPSGLSCGFPYHYEFTSDMPAVATVRGFASGPSVCQAPDDLPDNGVLYVTAVVPGVAHVRAEGCCGELSTITVLPQLRPVEIHARATRVLVGEAVALTALITNAEQTPLFFWFRGRIGDFSHPIQQSADPRLTFIGSEPGVAFFWVQAFEGSAMTSAEIGIEIFIPPRKRAAH